MRAFVTGATGFIGGAVVRRLLEAGNEVRALVLPGCDTRQIEGLAIERVDGDVRDVESVQRGMADCDWVFHLAAIYSFRGHPWEDFQQVNIEGTQRVLQTALDQGVKRIVHTSSVITVGVNADRSPANEETPSTLAHMYGHYARSKFLSEEVARDFAQQGLPVVIVNPTSPMGEGDYRPTPTGTVIVDYLNGRMPAYVDTAMNIVDVEDVAAGHLLAAERGRVGERYLLGGENLTLKEFLDLLSEASGLPPVRFKVPIAVVQAWSYVDAAIDRLIPGYTAWATPEEARQSNKWMNFDVSKAINELGLPQTPATEILRKAVAWYRANGYAP
jgi:dihydroflavonol-4-reductase